MVITSAVSGLLLSSTPTLTEKLVTVRFPGSTTYTGGVCPSVSTIVPVDALRDPEICKENMAMPPHHQGSNIYYHCKSECMAAPHGHPDHNYKCCEVSLFCLILKLYCTQVLTKYSGRVELASHLMQSIEPTVSRVG
jgi:hypothetical protein